MIEDGGRLYLRVVTVRLPCYEIPGKLNPCFGLAL